MPIASSDVRFEGQSGHRPERERMSPSVKREEKLIAFVASTDRLK
jgi:hypothetical protein